MLTLQPNTLVLFVEKCEMLFSFCSSQIFSSKISVFVISIIKTSKERNLTTLLIFNHSPLQVKKEKDRKAAESHSKTSDNDSVSSQQASSSVSDTTSVQSGVAGPSGAKGVSGQQYTPHSQSSTSGAGQQHQSQSSSQQQQQQQPTQQPLPSVSAAHQSGVRILVM